MTVCNMSIEAGARAGMIAPDDVTFAYLEGRPGAPTGAEWERALERWRSLRTDPERRLRPRGHASTLAQLKPQVTWGTNPGMVAPVDGVVPDPADYDDADERDAVERALRYMDLAPGTPLVDVRIDKVFIGSCTNARIEDLRTAAQVVAGRRVADGVQRDRRARLGAGEAAGRGRRACTTSSSRPASSGGAPGCSMCLGMNPDVLAARRALRVDVEPQLRGPAGRRRAHASRQPGDGGGRGGQRPLHRRQGARMRRAAHRHGQRRDPRPRRRRHRPDHPEAVPEADRALGLRRVPVLRLDEGRRRSSCTARYPGRVDPDRRAATSAAARRASMRRGRSRTTASGS